MAASPGGMTRAPTDGQLRLITKVARMYHERGVRQTDIAETLHLSQARVSRCSSALQSSASFAPSSLSPRECTPRSKKRSRIGTA